METVIQKISFVTVNYQCSTATLGFIRSVDALDLPPDTRTEIIVVDNSPTEADFRLLADNFADRRADITLVRSESNLGYFEGLNFGISKIDRSARYVVVGNPDLVISRDFLVNLLGVSYPEDCFVISPSIRTLNGKEQNPQYRDEFRPFHRILLSVYFAGYTFARIIEAAKRILRIDSSMRIHASDTLSPIFMGHGSCYVLTALYFAHVRTLPRRVFLFGEEALLSEVVFLFRGRIYFDPRLRVVHDEHTSVGKIPSAEHYKLARDSYRVYRRYLHR